MQRTAVGSYTVKKHMDWIDIHNVGVSHFGIHPDKMQRHDIRFDVCHVRCAITRKLMTHLRTFMMTTTPELMEMFSCLIHTFWSEFNVLIWNMDRPFTSFLGTELLQFIRNSQLIIDFLKKHFSETETLQDLCDGLELWNKISPFLVIGKIDNVETYQEKLDEFNENLKAFYDVGGRTFLTKNIEHPGFDETFYMHTLRFYMPMIAQETLREHNMGLGVFTMQGYERRNKESKTL